MTTVLRRQYCVRHLTRWLRGVLCRFRWSTRCVSVYRASEPSTPLHSASLGIKPAILIPHYDADSCTLFLTGRVSARRVLTGVVRHFILTTSVDFHVLLLKHTQFQRCRATLPSKRLKCPRNFRIYFNCQVRLFIVIFSLKKSVP